MVDNYAAIVSGLKVEDDSRLTSTNQAFQDNYEVPSPRLHTHLPKQNA